jgi:anaerobic magnesium-protoporphyrin IX monomethyl ester cyclase
MKILFIFPNINDAGYKLVGVSTLSALAKKAGHETALFDTSFMDLGDITNTTKIKDLKREKGTNRKIGEKILDFKPISDQSVFNKQKVDLKATLISKLKSFKPDLVGVSCLSTEWYLSQLILNYTKEYDPSIFTIVGGRHCIADPEGTIEHPSVDAVCVGEGELAFMRLLEGLEKGELDYEIPGLRIKNQNGKIHQNPPKGYLLELDDLPYIDNEIYEEGQFYRPFYGKLWRSLDFNLMRGCNEFCNYCQMPKMYTFYGNDRTIRRYSIDRAIDELAWQKKKWNLEFLRFHDESFLIVSNQYLEEFAKKYEKQVGVPFVVDVSPLTVNPEKARYLKDMGCVSVSMGFETGNEAFRKGQNKAVSSKQALKSFHSIADMNIRTVSFNMIGFPGETRDLIFDTIDFMRAAKVHSPSIGFVYPFKGTALRDQVIKENLFDPLIEEYGSAQWCRDYPAIQNPDISPEEYAGIFRTFIFYCKMPRKYWGDLRIAEKLNDQGDAMFEKMSEVYLNEYTDVSCAEDEKDRYTPDIVNDERGQYKPELTGDALFPHST